MFPKILSSFPTPVFRVSTHNQKTGFSKKTGFYLDGGTLGR